MQPHETQIQPMEKEAAMTNEQILAEIREANLTYLMLAQNLIRQDKAEAVFRLGLNEEAADILASLSAPRCSSWRHATRCCAASAWTTTWCGAC